MMEFRVKKNPCIIEKYKGSKVPGSKVQRLKIGDLRCRLARNCFIFFVLIG